ncbi:neutral zinc metallopeptidase [Kribbella sp. NPDC058245]|uniref:neutral zinc metallopeptidase n=1 Tax=Kribbella sp. NPDC058245 TaxID=3346399 RepID=UPI0036EF4F19
MSDSGNPPRGDEPADGENAAPPERGDASSPKWWTGSEAKREFQDPSGSEEPRPANNWFGDGWTARRPDETTPGRSTPPPPNRPTQPAPNQTGPNQPGPGQAGRPSQPAARQPSRPNSPQPAPGPARPPQSGPAGPGRQQPPYSAPPQQSAPQARAPQQPPGHGRPVQSGPAQGGPPPQQSGGSYLWSPPEPQAQQSSGPRHAAGGGPVGPMGQPVQQPPTWQYPPIPIPQPPGAGRRRKPRKTPRALLIGLVVLAVVVVGTGITLLIGNLSDDEAAPPPANPPVAETPSTNPSQPAETPSEDPQPSATPTGPDTAAADKVVTNSNLYAVGLLAPSKCPEPPFVPTSFALATNYYNRLLACVNATWVPAMKKVKVKYRGPKVAVYNGKVASPCGVQRSVRAAYCGANETIYMPFAVDARAYRSNPLYARALMLSTFAHEYGHHVQKRTGILAASLERAQNMNAGQKLEESRRRELQASCLGAAYLGINSGFIPITGPLLQAYRSLISNSGDDFARPRVHDHGNKASNYQWNIAGFNTKRPGSCNTFKAGQARVA